MKAALAILCAIGACALNAQALPAFEAASIRPSSADASSVRLKFSGSRFTAENCTLSYIIQQAYGLRDFQLTGVPAWALDGTGTRFDIQAEVAGAPGGDQLKLMTQALLADRFQLKVHREARPVSVYALVVTKNGSKLQAPKPGERRQIESYPGFVGGTNVDMPLFIDEFSNKVDRPVIDKTEILGPFDFTLHWTPDAPGNADPALGSVFTAIQEQLGLKLDPQKLPMEVLVIDHIERPTAN